MSTENISPIEHACEMVANKNVELRQLAMYESQQQMYPETTNHLPTTSNVVLKLTQSLQGVIDAAVNGGVAKYASAFFSPNFDDLANGEFVLQLHNLLMEQVNILESALSVHERLVSNDIRPLHAHLVERFSQMKKSLPQQIKLPDQFSTATISPTLTDGHFKTPTKSLLRKTSIVHSPLPPVPSPPTSRESGLQTNTSVRIYSLIFKLYLTKFSKKLESTISLFAYTTFLSFNRMKMLLLEVLSSQTMITSVVK